VLEEVVVTGELCDALCRSKEEEDRQRGFRADNQPQSHDGMEEVKVNAQRQASSDGLPTVEVRGKRVKGRELTECEKRVLTPYIPKIDLDSARFYDGRVPFYLSQRFAGITRGRRIYVRAGEYDSMTPEGMATLGHELIHVGQYREGMTWMSYALSSMRGYDHAGPYEAPAYVVSERILKDLTEDGFSGCVKP
jgi:hypothetical protein